MCIKTSTESRTKKYVGMVQKFCFRLCKPVHRHGVDVDVIWKVNSHVS
jgi:hypothetical protein